MTDAYLEPAASLAEKLGGLEALAAAAGVSISRASRYRQPKDKGGTGGLIPSHRQQRILNWAREHKKQIDPRDFFPPEKVGADKAREVA